jgi:hypothetical protein
MRGNEVRCRIVVLFFALILMHSPLAAAEISPTAKKPEAYKLPPGAKFVPREQVAKRFGLSPRETIATHPEIEKAALRIFPDWGISDLAINSEEENRILRLRGGRELLILSGRGWGHCGGGQSALIYDLKSKVAATAVYEVDGSDDLPAVLEKESLIFRNGGLRPQKDVFAILWLTMKDVRNGGGPPDCYDYDSETSDEDMSDLE